MTRRSYMYVLRAHLRKSGRGVALVRLDNLATLKLDIGVGRVDDLLKLVVDDREGGEALALTELATPARGDGVVTDGDRATVGVVGADGTGLLNNVLNTLGGGTVDDAEVPGARNVVVAAGTLEVLDGPLAGGSHHGLGGLGLRSGSSHDGGGGEEGGEEELGDLHFGDGDDPKG